MDQIKILIIDDHTLFRNGLRSLLQRETECEIIGEAADGLEGIKLVTKLHPDVVLLDLDMPVMNGKEALIQILNINSEQIVLMLTVSEDAIDLTECMAYGARGFLLKNVDAEFLIESIDKAVKGDTVFSPEMTQKLVNQLISRQELIKDQKKIEINSKLLTSRELEILAFITKGESNKQIARELNISENTIKVHVQNILKKLGVNSRLQAAVIALRFELLIEE